MMITLDNLAHRYHCLPSQALSHANTLDLRVLHLSSAWQRHQQDEAANPGSSSRRTPSTDQLQAMVNAVRNKK